MSDDAAARARYCAGALRALHAFEAAVDPRVLSDFDDTRGDPREPDKEPMGLRRMSQKIRTNAYAATNTWSGDMGLICKRFIRDSDGSVRRWMGNCLYLLFSALMSDDKAKVAHWQTKIKELEAAYMADQQARTEANRARALSDAPATVAEQSANARPTAMSDSDDDKPLAAVLYKPAHDGVESGSGSDSEDGGDASDDEALINKVAGKRAAATVKKATAATKKLAAKKAASIKKTASTKKEKAAITDSSKKQPAAAVVPPSGSKADPSLAPAVGIIAVGAPAAPSSGGLLNSAAATSSSAGPTAAATHAPAVSVSAASLGTALLRQHESSITLMRYAEQLELDRAQLAGEKTKLGSSIERLTQEQADLQRQLKELAEQADKVPLLEAALRLRNREVEEARRRLMAADDAAKEHAEQSRRSLENVQQLLDEKEDELKQQTAAASHKAAEAKRQLEAQTKVNQQLESDLIQASQDIARVRQANGRLTQEKMQLDQDKTLLQRQIDDRLAELATAESHIAAAVGWAERIVSLKQAAGGADAQSPGQLILAGKRKAESELESEAKRRRSAEDKLDALAEQMDKTDKCVVCADKQPDVLFQSCNHLACCNECADQLEQGAAGDPACPLCREPLDSSDIIKVFRA